jgi:hypothetical protein
MLTILRRMSRATAIGTCTRCGLPLRGGLCPNGHPQRAARRRRRRWPRVLRIASVPAAIALLLYAGLLWYPQQAAAGVMVPSSEEFDEVRTAYEGTVGAFPNSPDPAVLAQQAAALLGAADDTRAAILDAETRLEGRTPLSIPVLNRRPPLPLARDLRDRMLAFYLGALELTADMEGVAGYMSQASGVLPKLEDLRGALGNPTTPRQVDGALPAARAVADQLLADLDALAAPPEVGSLHGALRAIAGTTRGQLDELDKIRGRTARPLIATLVTEIGAQLDSFRETYVGGPASVLEAGFTSRMTELANQIRAIDDGLARLRDEHGLADVVAREPEPML